MTDIETLSSAAMQGRKTGSAGAELARQFIIQRYTQLQLKAFSQGYQQVFNYGFGDKKAGSNVLGYLRGCRYPEHYVVVTAHYDHLGKQGRKIFHGADDNGSGVAVMLALAAKLRQNCPVYSYIFLATDAEENGLYGSKAFVAAAPVPLSNIVLNLNLDMLGRPDRRGRLYLTGAKRYPQLIAALEPAFSKLQFLHHRGPGRMVRDNPRYDWLNASDHGPFHRAGVACLFFGGQEHPHYHTPDDTWQRIDKAFLDMAMQAVWHSVQWLEHQAPPTLQSPAA
ncbi:M28 family peptidase [Rheinheimera maricola]|uniref:M28 family peptidase n=1 Tax=Rheinheimera maricola TaxID=2793282 RepID=A0ABS7XBL4_9GAMM|nr:M28 family peptidase [Rheinheimera maricola]MBZ9612545.1 M28 family peptidase [Rheinheimera maricola]